MTQKNTSPTKYIVDIGVIRTAPKLHQTLSDLVQISPGVLSLLLMIVLEVIEKLTGRLATEYKRTIVIYREVSLFKKEVVYEEQVPSDIQEFEFSKRLYHLEKAAEKFEIEETLNKLLNGEKKLFEENGV